MIQSFTGKALFRTRNVFTDMNAQSKLTAWFALCSPTKNLISSGPSAVVSSPFLSQPLVDRLVRDPRSDLTLLASRPDRETVCDNQPPFSRQRPYCEISRVEDSFRQLRISQAF